MSVKLRLTGPWANWDDTLAGQEVYFPVSEYPDRKKATHELRGLIEEVGEDELTPGRAKKKTVNVCTKDCEEYCEEPKHQQAIEVWVYTPKVRADRIPSVPIIMRCPSCRLLCVSGSRNRKTYIHGAYNPIAGKVDHCPGSKQPALDPKTTTRV